MAGSRALILSGRFSLTSAMPTFMEMLTRSLIRRACQEARDDAASGGARVGAPGSERAAAEANTAMTAPRRRYTPGRLRHLTGAAIAVAALLASTAGPVSGDPSQTPRSAPQRDRKSTRLKPSP